MTCCSDHPYIHQESFEIESLYIVVDFFLMYKEGRLTKIVVNALGQETQEWL